MSDTYILARSREPSAAIEFSADVPYEEALNIVGEWIKTQNDPDNTVYEIRRVPAADSKPLDPDWVRTYEDLRDELGHWRTLHRRDACPQAQVSLAKDRLEGHIASSKRK